jgi:hypothetical protein
MKEVAMPSVTTHHDMDLLAKLDAQAEWYDHGHGALHAAAAAEIRRLDALIPETQQPLVVEKKTVSVEVVETPSGGLQLPPDESLTSEEIEEIVSEEIEEQQHEETRRHPRRPRHR